mgnify:CR=1 FL=1
MLFDILLPRATDPSALAMRRSPLEVPFTWKPTGWYQIGWSSDYPAAEAVPLRYFGEDLVAYRGEDGSLHVLEGHCKHLGAHLGHGGKVVGDCIQCPFPVSYTHLTLPTNA